MTMFESVESLCLSRAAGILSGLLEEWNYTSIPTTQAFAFINTAFVESGGNFRPIRRLPVFGC